MDYLGCYNGKIIYTFGLKKKANAEQHITLKGYFCVLEYFRLQSQLACVEQPRMKASYQSTKICGNVWIHWRLT